MRREQNTFIYQREALVECERKALFFTPDAIKEVLTSAGVLFFLVSELLYVYVYVRARVNWEINRFDENDGKIIL